MVEQFSGPQNYPAMPPAPAEPVARPPRLVPVAAVLLMVNLAHRGKRWAWRRLMWLSLAGCAGMIFLLTRHYPVIFKVEQVLQLLVLAAIAVCVLHPETRAHYAKRR